MNSAISPNGRRGLWAFFGLLVVFLYAPIVILVVFSFNDRVFVSFPWQGFTFRWYREFLGNDVMVSAL
ncbi:MAG: ABC transporter permease, partial [Actinomycetota bacterium]